MKLDCFQCFPCSQLIIVEFCQIAPDNTAALVSFQPKGRKEQAAIKKLFEV